jgi:hypothetical protein
VTEEMCLICIEFKKETLTVSEGWRNLREMKEGMTDEHYDEVVSMLIEDYESEQEDLLSEDGEDIEELLNKMDQEAEKLIFEWDLNLGDDNEERDTYDTSHPWYIPGFED